MDTAIQTFESAWAFTRQLTFDFIEAIPDHRWEFSPHERYAPFHKQVRHIVCVQGVYIAGLRDRTTDFGKKHSHYRGPLDRASLVTALHEKDAELATTLRSIEASGEEDLTIEFYGPQSLGGFLNVIGTHESIHHGEWGVLATLSGFETPQSWKLNWGL